MKMKIESITGDNKTSTANFLEGESYGSTNTTPATPLVEKHFGSDLMLTLFVTFVLLMVLLHCYLKSRQNKHIDNMHSRNNYSFQWDTHAESSVARKYRNGPWYFMFEPYWWQISIWNIPSSHEIITRLRILDYALNRLNDNNCKTTWPDHIWF